MIDSLQALIASLREELEQYGEMLARLDSQQDSIFRRAADDLLVSVSAVQEQGAVLQNRRKIREEMQHTLARRLSLSFDATFAQILEHIPADYRPLLRALVEENNQLLLRVQQRARQNHLLLRRSLDLMQQFMHSLFPVAPSKTYDLSGNQLPETVRSCALMDAAC